jgi:hypothetical protein
MTGAFSAQSFQVSSFSENAFWFDGAAEVVNDNIIIRRRRRWMRR